MGREIRSNSHVDPANTLQVAFRVVQQDSYIELHIAHAVFWFT